ncbi:hypothetical protein [Chryseobacterium koreense]|uniref:hypothetical protein n=1 Tax=Chryseobacterium koreense TaxID=232216 RepID=UPI0026E94290|nr:hypothetical protein [Chryseobacterium koreense]
MEVFLEIVFGRLITQYLGLNTRYLFFKIFNKNILKENLRNAQTDELNSLGQGFYNSFIGLFVFCLLVIGIVYILDFFGII